jgi:hypothetical protein
VLTALSATQLHRALGRQGAGAVAPCPQSIDTVPFPRPLSAVGCMSEGILVVSAGANAAVPG